MQTGYREIVSVANSSFFGSVSVTIPMLVLLFAMPEPAYAPHTFQFSRERKRPHGYSYIAQKDADTKSHFCNV